MPSQNQPQRDCDIVIFGATGFTGRLVAEYLADQAGGGNGGAEPMRWAIAGRHSEKLEQLKNTLEQRNPACSSVGVIQAELHDWASLVFMAQRARVVLTTVGPFIKDGDRLVHACITGGADYVDITGEPEFVDSVINQFYAQARESGRRIVNCCGFDSIPHDLGALYTVEQLPEGVPIEIEGFVRSRGSVSGGTWQSAITAMARLRASRRQTVAHRAGNTADRSSTESSSGRRVYAIKPRLRYHRDLKGWVFPLPTIDGSIVRRSARGIERYGPSFGYAHYGVSRALHRIAMLGAGLGVVFALAQLGPTRNFLLERKKSGQGPDARERASNWFEVKFVGKADNTKVTTRVSGGDPGYGETAKMAAEAALCLAFDRDRLPDVAGVLTPAIAMGDVLIERLQKAGLRFEVLQTSQ